MNLNGSRLVSANDLVGIQGGISFFLLKKVFSVKGFRKLAQYCGSSTKCWPSLQSTFLQWKKEILHIVLVLQKNVCVGRFGRIICSRRGYGVGSTESESWPDKTCGVVARPASGGSLAVQVLLGGVDCTDCDCIR